MKLPFITNEEFKERVKKTQAKMSEQGFDALLCYGNEAEPQFVRYFSDYWPSFETAGVLIPAKGGAALLIGPESYTYAADRSRIPEIRKLKAFRESSEPEYPGKKLDTFESVFKEICGGAKFKRFGVAGLPLMTVGVYGALTDALKSFGGVLPEKADDIVSGLRMIKTPDELACMRAAGEITRLTMDYVIKNIRVGMTECQVAGLALGKMHELGAERESYPPWILTGDGSDQAISRPRNKEIKQGDLTFMQIGARVSGYASTIGRAVNFGKMSDGRRKLIGTLYEAQERIFETAHAGVQARDIAVNHENFIKSRGYGDMLLYGPCHGNGLMEGEAPWMETSSDFVLQENMTFCACLFLGSNQTKTGVRIEDTFRVTKGRAESLTAYPRDFWEL